MLTKIVRIVTFTGFAVAVCIAALVLLTLDAYFRSKPIHPFESPVHWILLAGPVLESFSALSLRGDPKARRPRRFSLWFLKKSRRAKRKLIASQPWIAAAVPIAVLAFAALWVPEYLIQPFWTDHEHMLIMARLWDLGEFPWTAMRTYQFPGGMETAWLSARIFGWGRSTGFFATNLALLAGLGLTLVAWSGRQLGSRAYGFGGMLALMLVESCQPFTTSAQRDSQTTWLVMIAFLAPAALARRRIGLSLSAVSFALALAIRPHALLFFPLVVCGIYWHELTEGDLGKISIRSLGSGIVRDRSLRFWGVAFTLATLAFMSPILGPSRTPAFLEAMKFPLSQPGDYSRGAFFAWRKVLKHSLTNNRHVLYLMFCGAMIAAPASTPKWRRIGLILVWTGFCGGVYRAVHPVDHGYLKLPLQFLECLGIAVFPAWILSHFHRIPTFVAISAVGFVAVVANPGSPPYVSVREWPAAVRDLAGIEPMGISPPAARHAYPAPPGRYHYDWSDCQSAEQWLRENTEPATRILNLLSYQPFPSILATVDRLPVGRLESFVMLIWFDRYDFDSEFVASLEAAPSGSVVVWDDERINREYSAQVPTIGDFIRRTCREAARFGEIEIWVKP